MNDFYTNICMYWYANEVYFQIVRLFLLLLCDFGDDCVCVSLYETNE